MKTNQLKTIYSFLPLLLGFLVGTSNYANAVTLDATLRGTVSWEASGDNATGNIFQQWSHGLYSADASYLAGNSYQEFGTEFFSTEDRSFFRFDLSSLASETWVNGATLLLEHSGTSDTFTYSVAFGDEDASPDYGPGVPNSNDPTMEDPREFFLSLGGFGGIAGGTFGSASVAGANDGEILQVPHTATALVNINSAHLTDSPITVGGGISGGNGSMFSGTGPTHSTQLDLTTVANTAPTPLFGSLTITLGDGATLDGSSSHDPDSSYGDSIVSFQWDLDDDGDYDFDNPSPILALTATELANFGIDAAGSYDISLRVEDAWGASATVIQSLTVTQIPEPSTLALLSLAVLALLGHRRIRNSD